MENAGKPPNHAAAAAPWRSTRKKWKNFTNVTLNQSGRPIRAVLTDKTTEEVFGKINRECVREKINEVRATKGKEPWHFGVESARATVNRERVGLSVDDLSQIFEECRGENDGKDYTVDAIEQRARDFLLHSHEQGGLLYTDPKDQTRAYNREYTADEYNIIFAGVFIDPVGSQTQSMHEDINADRDPIWNIVIPIVLTSPAMTAPSDRCRLACERNPMGINQSTMWDAGWPHQGLGNDTSSDRIMLHLVLAPKWMVTPSTGAEDEREWDISALDLKFAENDRSFIRFVQHGPPGADVLPGSHGHLSIEYNNGKTIHDPRGVMWSWVERAMAARSGN